ncbi:tryptophan halogenase family protein [Sphingomonas baiyangensis]|uniref:Tryptophan 7-halogenase n=1 Tax=Sphingomonas baiyangensis TaxID=2572576 RepID=A0A4U1L7R3_9SPHN|nr:tryptophan halogenase family protein [Sphingomonas baiyangensis]TKD52794.1 tryptophan 7-halogenase [Sphingomonas baiyangensis]
MADRVTSVVIVGGGTAGWLAACRIAAAADPHADTPLRVTLIESPDIPTIGVGEGTWPTMRRTLAAIGIAEADFLVACDASFKQGSRFVGWRDGAPDDAYLHPFTPPVEGDARAILAGWQARGALPFAAAVSPQPHVCARDLAPRQPAMPDYAGALNYGYHLDAGRFAALLRRHGVERLGVRHLRDHVDRVVLAQNGDIAAVETRAGGAVAGDLFIDCTGHAALLIGERYGVPFVDRSDVLFNDRALAVQVPVAPGSPIASQTDATAHAAGWIWDIGLPGRRGIGCVYSSAHLGDDEAADTLAAYVRRTMPDADAAALAPRRLAFRSGHRARFWERNCLAIGLSAGFLEPLEASAIVLIELSLDALVGDFPVTRGGMAHHAARFNARFAYRWDRIVEFLKLHYVPSVRSEPYWRDHRAAASIPGRLADLLAMWREAPPSARDFGAEDEIFPAASHQYVLYGMGALPPPAGAMRVADRAGVAQRMAQAAERARALAASLPTNRAYLDALHAQAPALEGMR